MPDDESFEHVVHISIQQGVVWVEDENETSQILDAKKDGFKVDVGGDIGGESNQKHKIYNVLDQV